MKWNYNMDKNIGFWRIFSSIPFWVLLDFWGKLLIQILIFLNFFKITISPWQLVTHKYKTFLSYCSFFWRAIIFTYRKRGNHFLSSPLKKPLSSCEYCLYALCCHRLCVGVVVVVGVFVTALSWCYHLFDVHFKVSDEI